MFVWFRFLTAAVSRLKPNSTKILLEVETLVLRKETTQVIVEMRKLSSTFISQHATLEALHKLMVALQRKF